MDSSPVAGPSRSSARSTSSASSSSSLRQRDNQPPLAHTTMEGSSASTSAHQDETDSEAGSIEEEEPVFKYRKLGGHIRETLSTDRAAAIAAGTRILALGTEHGMVHIFSKDGAKISSYRPHSVNITCIRVDEDDQHAVTSSVDGRVLIRSLTSPETLAFDYKRPVSALALEPDFAKRTSRAFVCGGLAGKLVLQEKGWLGYKERVLHSGEGPIWAVEWRRNWIAWANDLGVAIMDTTSGQRIGHIERAENQPRAELYKCSMLWKDDFTLVISWADRINVVRIRPKSRSQVESGTAPFGIEITGIFQMDCMLSGLALLDTKFVILAFLPSLSETSGESASTSPQSTRPEIRLIDDGEELAADVLDVSNYQQNRCNQYSLIQGRSGDRNSYLVLCPYEVIEVKPRDDEDHIDWLTDHEQFDEALSAADDLGKKRGRPFDTKQIGSRYIRHLMRKGDFPEAAALAPKVFKSDVLAWTEGIRLFLNEHRLTDILPLIPTSHPTLGRAIYDEILRILLSEDKQKLGLVIKEWPTSIYDSEGLLADVQTELEANEDDNELLECLGELYLAIRQPPKALTIFLQLKRPQALDIIREYNLFPDIQDQVALLVDQDPDSGAIDLLVDHVHSIPVERVVYQLKARPDHLFRYLKALFRKDPSLCFQFSDTLISLSATYEPSILTSIFRTSNSYDLELAYKICEERDYVPEMVYLLGRMGNNRQALMLIIERLGDVQEAIRFASEQADEDLWEVLLQYSESRPDFIRALLEHVGTEIKPIRLITRIRNGMEIIGLRPALIKIMQTSNLQVSLSEDCNRILSSDCALLSTSLQKAQVAGIPLSAVSVCLICGNNIIKQTSLPFFCGHTVHAACAALPRDALLPEHGEQVHELLLASNADARRRQLGAKLAHAAMLRTRIGGCPACSQGRTSVMSY